MGDKLAGPESQTMGDDGQTMGYKLAGSERFFQGLFNGRISPCKGLCNSVATKHL